MNEVNYSSQVAIIDANWNLYLENNQRIWKVSFYWWKIEENETPIEAAKREIAEETWLIITPWGLISIWQDWPKVFPKWTFISNLFVYYITNEVWEILEYEKKSIKIPLSYILDELLNQDKFAFDLLEFKKRLVLLLS